MELFIVARFHARVGQDEALAALMQEQSSPCAPSPDA